MMNLYICVFKILFSVLLCNALTTSAAVPPDAADASSVPEIIFTMPFDVTLENKEKVTINLKLRAGDDPAIFARDIAEKYNLDKLTYRWILRNFQHAVARLNEEPIVTLEVNTADGTRFEPITVRYGDDLAMLSRTYCFSHGLDLDTGNAIYQNLLASVPQHADIAWVDRRRTHSQHSVDPNSPMSTFTTPKFDSDCELSAVVVSVGDFELLKNLVSKFPQSDLVCEVIVVEEPGASSLQNRARMLETFPGFNFVFKSQLDKGIKKSLSMAIGMVHSRYLLLLSTAWEPQALDDGHLRSSLAIMKADHKNPMVQMSLVDPNSPDQSSDGINSGGWRRVVKFENGLEVEYVENEFGSMYLEHAISGRWPGFALLPSITDLDVLSKDFIVDVSGIDDNDFESNLAMKLWDNGFVTSHLPGSSNYKIVGGQ